jgi:hypothetical protein
MATENDKGWQKYLQAKEIHFDQPSYLVNATELKQLAGREPRLLSKFDTPEQLAAPFRDAGYTLLPVRNGQYLIVRGNLFVEILPCPTQRQFASRLAFPLATAGRGSSESQYIDQAFNEGLLAEFLGIEGLLLQTIRGREYTGQFRFSFSDVEVAVESVQIEVDSGYESLRDIVLVEAKIGVPRHFNVRQLYYPYRHFSLLAPHKRVRTVFLSYDIPTSAYHLYEYGFPRPGDPLSVQQQKCSVYRIAAQPRLTIYDLLDHRFETSNDIVPQADDLNKVFELLLLVESGVNNAREAADYFVFDQRQSNYYREAAEYLGLLQSTPDEGYTLTPGGIAVLSEPPQTQARALARAIVNSWVFRELVGRAQANGKFTIGDVDQVITDAIGKEGKPRYGGSTVHRRRQTIVAWLRWLEQEIGCFKSSAGGFSLA